MYFSSVLMFNACQNYFIFQCLNSYDRAVELLKAAIETDDVSLPVSTMHCIFDLQLLIQIVIYIYVSKCSSIAKKLIINIFNSHVQIFQYRVHEQRF